MMHIAIVLAIILLVVPASWAEAPAADPVSTTTIPGNSRGYGPPPNDPRGLPTGLPGFGTPGAKTADEQKVKVVPRPTADAP